MPGVVLDACRARSRSSTACSTPPRPPRCARAFSAISSVSAPPTTSRRAPKLLIAPHAGYEYCGAVAAHAYALLGRRREPIVRRVVLLGPAHRVALGGLAAPSAEAFETPLGEVALDVAALAGLGRPAAGRSERPRARARAFARGPAAVPADAARQLHPRAAGRRRRRRRGGGAGARAPVGRRRDADRDQFGSLALPALRAGASRRPVPPRGASWRSTPASRPHEACGAAAINGALLRGAPPRSRAAPARPAQLRRHGRRPRPCRRLRRDRIRGGLAVSPHPARWWHALDDGRIQCDLCPRDCRLHEGQRGFCFVRQREGDAMVLTTYGRSLGLLRRPDREEAAQPLLPRHAACCRSAPPAATSAASSARTGTSRSRARWTACSTRRRPSAIAAAARASWLPRAWPSPTTTR